MIDFTTAMPLQDAVDSLSKRTPLGAKLGSAEWELLAVEIRRRAFISATVEDERILALMQEKLVQRVKLEKTRLADGGEGAHMDRGRFISEMRDELRAAGYRRPADVKKGSVRDLKSSRRLGLIWDMNLAQAEGFARHKAAMDPDILAAFPVLEFVRLEQRMERRNWPARWRALGGKFYPGPSEYPEGRMMALATDPIWPALNRFGVPWKPFDWGSGMGTKRIRRREAEKLGVMSADDPDPVPMDLDFNDGASMSLRGIPAAGRQRIADALAGEVEIEGDVIRLRQTDAMGGFWSPRRWRKPAASDAEDRPAPKPTDKPLTETIRVQESSSFPDAVAEISRALKLADDVHGDGVLPKLEVIVRKPFFPSDDDEHARYAPVSKPGRRPALEVDPRAKSPAFAALHELGHLLDNLGLHQPSPARTYASEGQPSLMPLMDEIRKTSAARLLAVELGADSVALTDKELFARAYAQFIVGESRDPALTAELLDFRRGGWEPGGYPRNLQWAPADFAAVRKAFLDLFRNSNWRIGRAEGGGR